MTWFAPRPRKIGSIQTRPTVMIIKLIIKPQVKLAATVFPLCWLLFCPWLMLNLVAIALNLCIVSFTKNRYIASTVNILIVIPTCMLSGVFWDFEVMPDYLQRIGNFMPQRVIYKCIENLQICDSFSYIYQYVFYIIGLALILFALSLFMFNMKS